MRVPVGKLLKKLGAWLLREVADDAAEIAAAKVKERIERANTRGSLGLK
jgi:hypothetical protein